MAVTAIEPARADRVEAATVAAGAGRSYPAGREGPSCSHKSASQEQGTATTWTASS